MSTMLLFTTTPASAMMPTIIAQVVVLLKDSALGFIVTSQDLLSQVNLILIAVIGAVGLNILVGYCGQISLGTGAFMAVGAYAAYNLQVRFDGMPLLVSLLGGGLAKFRPTGAGGSRDDGRDLIAEWQQAWPTGKFVDAAAPFRALDAKSPDKVFGLFNADHLDFNVDADRAKEPSLAELATFAVHKLQAGSKRSGKGYVLLVEGGRIDHGHHISNAYRALDELAEFSHAIDEVLKTIDLKDTLVLVTADHSHVFTMAGYPPRGNPILGFNRPIQGGEGGSRTDANGAVVDQLGRPMTTLGYMNGPLEVKSGGKTLNSTYPPTDPNFLQPKAFLTGSETHGGEDVGLFAGGPGSPLASGTIEQNSIFHIIASALGWR